MEIAFNRTIVELKLGLAFASSRSAIPFNRTIVELKLTRFHSFPKTLVNF